VQSCHTPLVRNAQRTDAERGAPPKSPDVSANLGGVQTCIMGISFRHRGFVYDSVREVVHDRGDAMHPSHPLIPHGEGTGAGRVNSRVLEMGIGKRRGRG